MAAFAVSLRRGLARQWHGAPGGSEVGEESRIDYDIFDLARCDRDAEFIVFEEVAKPVAVDQIHWRCSISGSLGFRVAGEGARCDEQTFVPSTGHRSSKAYGT
jgi:hypothetical protein